MVNRPIGFYREIEIPKRSGGIRTLSIPSPSLLEVQRVVNAHILKALPIHPDAHGFVKGRSIVTNASQHLGQKTLLKIDLKDFFPSVSVRRVISVFRYLGYAPNVSYYLASLCTLRGCLPQGSAASPSLSNAVARKLDLRLEGLAKRFELKYSRYADDLCFSGENIRPSTIKFIDEIVGSENFIINEKKTALLSGKTRKIVTGIVVNGPKLTLPKKYRRELKNSVHFIKKYGLISHMEKTQSFDLMLIDRLRGKIDFWLQVEPDSETAIRLRNDIDSIENDLTDPKHSLGS